MEELMDNLDPKPVVDPDVTGTEPPTWPPST